MLKLTQLKDPYEWKKKQKQKYIKKAHSLRKDSKVKITKVKSKELVLQFWWYF